MSLVKLDDLRAKVKAIDAMPTVPAMIAPLASALQQPLETVDMEKIVSLISRDSGISAQCVRIANSPLFGRRNTETVRAAVIALGLKRVEGILLSCCLNQFVPAAKWALEATAFWRHAMGCALVSSKLARLSGYDDPEKAYLAGLLHDLGILVNTLQYAEEFRRCVGLALESRRPLHLVEQECLGFTHSHSGAILARQWLFPEELIETIEFHHDVGAAPPERPLVWIVHLSDLLCRMRDLGYGYYEAIAVDLGSDEAWHHMAHHFPALAKLDLARMTMEIDGQFQEITALVDAAFKRPAHAGT